MSDFLNLSFSDISVETLYYAPDLKLYFPFSKNNSRYNRFATQILEVHQYNLLVKEDEIFLSNFPAGKILTSDGSFDKNILISGKNSTPSENIKIGAISQGKQIISLNHDILEEKFSLSSLLLLIQTNAYLEYLCYQEKKYFNQPVFKLLRIYHSKDDKDVKRRDILSTLIKIEGKITQNKIEWIKINKKNKLEYRNRTILLYNQQDERFVQIFGQNGKSLETVLRSYRKYFSEAELVEKKFYVIHEKTSKTDSPFEKNLHIKESSETDSIMWVSFASTEKEDESFIFDKLKICSDEKETINKIYFNQEFNVELYRYYEISLLKKEKNIEEVDNILKMIEKLSLEDRKKLIKKMIDLV